MQLLLPVLVLRPRTLIRAFELMELYADRPMDLTDPFLVTVARSFRYSTGIYSGSERLRDLSSAIEALAPVIQIIS